MGYLFRAKPSNQERMKSYSDAAAAFAALVGTGGISPALMYDSSMLPKPKSELLKACKAMWLWDKEQREAWTIVVLCLPQFQDGIGPTPLGLDVLSLDKSKDMAAQVVQMKMPSEERLAAQHAEEEHTLSWIKEMQDKGN